MFVELTEKILEALKEDKSLDVRFEELSPMEAATDKMVSVYLTGMSLHTEPVFGPLDDEESLWAVDYLIEGYTRGSNKDKLMISCDNLIRRIIRCLKTLKDDESIQELSIQRISTNFKTSDTGLVGISMPIVFIIRDLTKIKES